MVSYYVMLFIGSAQSFIIYYFTSQMAKITAEKLKVENVLTEM